MSGALNGLKLGHSSLWAAAILQGQATHSNAGPPSSVSVSVSAHTDDMSSGSFPTTPVVIVYIIGFVIAAWIILRQVFPGDGKTANWVLPWVPAVTRRDAAAMPFFPVFLLLPAILWPLIVAAFVLALILSGLWVTLSSATSCCGIPLPNMKEGEAGEGETAPDLEMGAVAGGEEGGAPGGGEGIGSDGASELSSASAESERPPPYASVAPDEDGEGETDGLLAKGTI